MKEQTNPFVVPGEVEDTLGRVSAVLTLLERFEEYEAEACDRDELPCHVARYGVVYIPAGIREAVEHMASDHVTLVHRRSIVEGGFSQPQAGD